MTDANMLFQRAKSTRANTSLLFTLLILIAAVATPSTHAQTFTVMYNYGANPGDPEFPFYPGDLAQGRDGSVYGIAPYGSNGWGGVYKITPAGRLKMIYSFDQFIGGTAIWTSGVQLAANGSFLGTTVGGGTGDCGDYSCGTVFNTSPNGEFTVLYNFSGGSDGDRTAAVPLQGADGNFYGTTMGGGTFGYGTVYKMTPTGQLTTLYEFDGTHGSDPFASVIQATNGNFYGTTETGGVAQGCGNCGTIFEITPSGQLTVLYNFDFTHGEGPYAPLIQASDGNFYGTAYWGGDFGDGVVFKVTPKGSLTVLHSFNGVDGQNLSAGLVQATDGNLYGVAFSGGSLGYGTIYRVALDGAFSVLYNFDHTTGAYPINLIQHTNSLFYGDTFWGGTTGAGVFYSLDMGLPPFVSLVSTLGKIGMSVGILGHGFTGTTAVSFNTTPATFTVFSDTYLTAVVPAGATTGFVAVTTPSGVLTSNKRFRVRQ